MGVVLDALFTVSRYAVLPAGLVGSALLVLGVRTGRRWLGQSGAIAAIAFIWPWMASFALHLAAHGIGSYPVDVPPFVCAPLLAAAIVLGTAVAGAAARGWKDWSGAWAAAGASAAGFAAVDAWENLDHTVVYPMPPIPLCMGFYLSTADLLAHGPLILVLCMVTAVVALAAQGVAPRIAPHALDRSADVATIVAAGAFLAGFLACVERPQPDEYVAGLPVVAEIHADRPRTPDELGPATLADDEQSAILKPWHDHLAASASLPDGLLVHSDGYEDSFELSGPKLSWSWYGGPEHWTANRFPRNATLALRRSNGDDIWLVTAGDRAIAFLDPVGLDDEAQPLSEWDSQSLLYLPWARIARRLAPPRSWVVAAMLAVFASLSLRTVTSRSDDGVRTLAVMRLAVLAVAVPLLVAAARGFVLPAIAQPTVAATPTHSRGGSDVSPG